MRSNIFEKISWNVIHDWCQGPGAWSQNIPEQCFPWTGWLQKSRKKAPWFFPEYFFKFPWFFSSLIIHEWPNFSKTFWFFSYLRKIHFKFLYVIVQHTQQIWHAHFNLLARMKNKFSGKSKRPRCVKLIRKNIESKIYKYIFS